MIILASESKQRRDLLRQIGIEPLVLSAHSIEQFQGEDISKEIQELAKCKVQAVLPLIPGHDKPIVDENIWAIGADTIILHKDQIYGKPLSQNHASEMLHELSGIIHRVFTGVCTWNISTGEYLTEVCETKVAFRNLDPETIKWYISTGEWRGAAGSYRIQGRGACIVDAIYGSYSNVVGLPLEILYGMLVKLHYRFR